MPVIIYQAQLKRTRQKENKTINRKKRDNGRQGVYPAAQIVNNYSIPIDFPHMIWYN